MAALVPVLTHYARRALSALMAPLEEALRVAETMDERELALAQYNVTYEIQAKLLVKEDVSDAKARAYVKAHQDMEATVIREAIRVEDWDLLRKRGGPYAEGLQETSELIKELQKRMRNTNGNGGCMHTHYLVTVNAKPDVRVAELERVVQRYVKCSMVRVAEYAFEQRGAIAEEMGKGLHVHILVEQRGDEMDGQFKHRTRRTFTKLVGNPKTHVDIRPVKSEWLDEKRAYLRGEKTGEGKADRVAIDRQWRVINSLRDYYTHENGVRQEETPRFRKRSLSEEASSDDASEAGSEEP